MALSRSAYLQLGQFASEHSSTDPASNLKVTPGDSFGYFTELDQRQPQWGGCSAGLDLLRATSDGRVKGCLSMPDELAEGDLRERDLWDIWFDENAFSYNRRFTNLAAGPNCCKCPQLERCRGGCTSMSFACTGKHHNDPYCFSSIQAEFSGAKDAGN